MEDVGKGAVITSTRERSGTRVGREGRMKAVDRESVKAGGRWERRSVENKSSGKAVSGEVCSVVEVYRLWEVKLGREGEERG